MAIASTTTATQVTKKSNSTKKTYKNKIKNKKTKKLMIIKEKKTDGRMKRKKENWTFEKRTMVSFYRLSSWIAVDLFLQKLIRFLLHPEGKKKTQICLIKPFYVTFYLQLLYSQALKKKLCTQTVSRSNYNLNES